MVKRINQAGFGHIVLVVGIVVITVIGLIGWKVMSTSSAGNSSVKESSQSAQEKTAEKEPDIALRNLGLISLDSIDITNQAVREYSTKNLKGFYTFGDTLSGGRINPNFEYASVKPGSKIVAAIDGVVAFISEQTDTKDFEVFIQPKEGSIWTIGYDHVTNIAVRKGDAVKAGDVIGEPAMQNNGLFRFEIQINKDENGATTHHCPTALLASNVKDMLLYDLTAMQSNWESTTGLELYDLVSQNPIGCSVKTLTPEQAEGN